MASGMDRDDIFVVEGSDTAGYLTEAAVPDALAELSRGQLGTRVQIEAEIDAMLMSVAEFWRMEPDEVMRLISGFSARCTTLEIHLHRVEGRDRQYTRIRTMQVVKLLAELDRQFKTHSRTVELRRQDLEVLRAGA